MPDLTGRTIERLRVDLHNEKATQVGRLSAWIGRRVYVSRSTSGAVS
jgi:hypothetical protein